MKDPANYFIAAILIFCAAIIFFLCDEKKECTEGGGVYVRGLWGMECIRMKP